MTKQARIFVEGIVQGVCFRAYTLDKAKSLGVTGLVRNLPDGRVEILAQGEEDGVMTLINWAHKGPNQARVDRVRVFWEKVETKYDDFKLTY